jgi:hypothetical protein
MVNLENLWSMMVYCKLFAESFHRLESNGMLLLAFRFNYNKLMYPYCGCTVPLTVVNRGNLQSVMVQAWGRLFAEPLPLIC